MKRPRDAIRGFVGGAVTLVDWSVAVGCLRSRGPEEFD